MVRQVVVGRIRNRCEAARWWDPMFLVVPNGIDLASFFFVFGRGSCGFLIILFTAFRDERVAKGLGLTKHLIVRSHKSLFFRKV